MIDKFLETASMDDRRHENPGRDYSVTTPETLEKVEQFYEENPRESIRRAGQMLGINRESLRIILQHFLKFHPYKVSVHQALNEQHMARRVKFCTSIYAKLEDKTIDHEKIIFSDEAHFYLDGYVNKQNMRFWAKENPNYVQSKKAHPVRVTAWAAITRHAVYITTFTENVNSAFYIQILNRRFYTWMSKNHIPEDSWFMQDGAAPHRTKDVFECLKKRFGQRVIGLGYDKFAGGGIEWPPYSPDLNPCDFFLWGFIKDKIYESAPGSEAELVKAINNQVKDITDDMLDRVYTGFLRRLEACSCSKGDHFEGIYI